MSDQGDMKSRTEDPNEANEGGDPLNDNHTNYNATNNSINNNDNDDNNNTNPPAPGSEVSPEAGDDGHGDADVPPSPGFSRHAPQGDDADVASEGDSHDMPPARGLPGQDPLGHFRDQQGSPSPQGGTEEREEPDGLFAPGQPQEGGAEEREEPDYFPSGQPQEKYSDSEEGPAAPAPRGREDDSEKASHNSGSGLSRPGVAFNPMPTYAPPATAPVEAEDAPAPGEEVTEKERSRKKEAEKRRKALEKAQDETMTYLSYHGRLDYWLGISMFWADKFMTLILYLQRVALISMWSLGWPKFFNDHIFVVFGFLLDFTAHHKDTNAIGSGTIFEGCEVICKISWPLLCLPILFLWVGLAAHKTLPLYYSRNIERILWSCVRIGLLPYMNATVRYFILNQNGDVDEPISTWSTPSSEFGVGAAILTMGLFWYFGYKRSSRPVLFRSRLRHEAFLRSREIEYKLKFSATYRNERLWMISSYYYAGWPWSLTHGTFDVCFLLLIVFAPPKIGVIVGVVVLGLEMLYCWAVDIYRCYSSSHVEQLFNIVIFVFTVFGVMQAYETRNALFVGLALDYFLLALHGFALIAYVVMLLYYFWDSHTFGINTIADKRAQEKWKRTFGAKGKAGQWLELDAIQFDTKRATDDQLDHEKFLKSDIMKKRAEEKERFYLPKQATFFSLNCASPHIWPVNGVMINEMLRRNEEDHLIDLLRAARKMLHNIAIMHNTADLIPTDEIKTHITRLQQCVTYCKRMRVTHHLNAIHPLQVTFEEMIDQFMFELRMFSGRTVTVGHNARKMIEVSRYLRLRMEARDRALALVSPLMRRVLIKLLALRLFIQLVEERPAHLLPGRREDAPLIGRDIFDSDNDSNEDTLNPNRQLRRLRLRSVDKTKSNASSPPQQGQDDLFDQPVPQGVIGEDVFDQTDNFYIKDNVDEFGLPLYRREDDTEERLTSALARQLANRQTQGASNNKSD